MLTDSREGSCCPWFTILISLVQYGPHKVELTRCYHCGICFCLLHPSRHNSLVILQLQFASPWPVPELCLAIGTRYLWLLLNNCTPTPPLLSRQLNILFICKSSHYLSLGRKKNALPESGIIHDPWRVIKRRLYIDNELLSHRRKNSVWIFHGADFHSSGEDKEGFFSFFSRNF